MKIKVKIKENIKELKYGKYTIKIDLNSINMIDGYIPIIGYKEIENKMIEVTTVVLDEDLNIVVPFRTEIVTKEDFECFNFNNDIKVYKKKKAIYRADENLFYVINLDDVAFENKDGNLIPVNPVRCFSAYYVIDARMIVMYFECSANLYDVINDEFIGNEFDMIEPADIPGKFNAFHVLKNKYSNPLYAKFLMDKKGKINNEVLLNNEVAAIIPLNILDDQTKMINYCDDCYSTYYELNENRKMVLM